MQTRFNSSCSNLEECIEYFIKRARQMLRFDFVLVKIFEHKEGCIAYFSNKDGIWQALYLYPEYRGKGMYAKMMPVKTTKVITSDDCGIEEYLKNNQYTFRVIPLNEDPKYKIISDYYGDKKAARTGLDYMNHIDEGLAILKWFGIDEEMDEDVYAAYAFHPIFQMDEDLRLNVDKLKFNNGNSISIIGRMRAETIIYAMEYRSVANEYLSDKIIDSYKDIRLSPLRQVNWMLIADKIQNYKDFQLHHEETHPRSKELDQYFKNWLNRLNITEYDYQEFKRRLLINPRIIRL